MSGYKCLCGVFVAFSLLSVSAAHGAPLKVVGFDDMSCRAWMAAKDDAEQRGLYVAWARGVLTGHNYANQTRQVSVVSRSTVENYVNRYCSQNPQGLFSDAVLRMSDEFSGRNAAITK